MLTVGMTAENAGHSGTAIAPILCDQDEFGKTIGEFDSRPPG
jgi:hypothetical protein